MNTGFFTRDTPVVFENDIMCPLPTGLKISESLLNLKRGNCSKIDLVCQNTSAHDIELKCRTSIGSIHLIRSVMPVAVRLKEENNEIKIQSKQEPKNSAAGHNDTDYNEAFVPDVFFIYTYSIKNLQYMITTIPIPNATLLRRRYPKEQNILSSQGS